MAQKKNDKKQGIESSIPKIIRKEEPIKKSYNKLPDFQFTPPAPKPKKEPKK